MEIKISYAQFKRSTHFANIVKFGIATDPTARQVFEMAVEALNQGFGGTEHGKKYEMKHFFESHIWEPMGDGLKAGLGMCLSYLTWNDLIPMVYVNPKSNNKQHRLKPGFDPTLYSFKVC